MKTYIVNLERSEKRREHIVKEAERCGLDYELVKAVDGKNLTEEDFNRLCDMEEVRKSPNWLTPGMIGCSLSHYEIYKKIVKDDVDVALVLEDDVILPDNLPELLADVAREIQKNEVILLYFFSFKPCRLSEQDVVAISNDYKIYFPIDINQPITTAGYILTKEAAKKLAKIVLPIRVGPDSWGYFYENKGFESFRCIYPVPLQQTGAKSDIHSQSLRGKISKFIDDYKIPGIYHLIRSIRLKNIESRSKVELVDLPSPISKNGRK